MRDRMHLGYVAFTLSVTLYFQESLVVARELGDRESELNVLNYLGLVNHDLSHYQTAITHLRESLSIARDIGSLLGEAASLNNIGEVYKSQGDTEQKPEILNKS